MYAFSTFTIITILVVQEIVTKYITNVLSWIKNNGQKKSNKIKSKLI